MSPKRLIVTKPQLQEYVDNKKAEKVFYDILEKIHSNEKHLNENVSHKKANQTVIKSYEMKNLITPKVQELLIKHGIVNKSNQIQ